MLSRLSRLKRKKDAGKTASFSSSLTVILWLRNDFKVFFCRGYRPDGESFREKTQVVFGKAGGQRGTETDLFDAEIDQGQKNGDCRIPVHGKEKIERRINAVTIKTFDQRGGRGNGVAGMVQMIFVREAGTIRRRTGIGIVEAVFPA